MAAPAPPPTYPYKIQSLLQANPTLPIHGVLDIDRDILANTPIDPTNLTNAKVVATKLKATLESPINPGVTEQMVQSAELRVTAIEEAHAAAEYGALGLMAGIARILERLDTIEARQVKMEARQIAMENRQIAMEGRLTVVEGRLTAVDNSLASIRADVQVNNAMIHNQRIIARNSASQPICQPLQKTVAGSGLELAKTVTRGNERRTLTAPLQPAEIGSLPPNFIINIINYTSKDISRLIVFYNESFGILEDDDEGTRRAKLTSFLTRF